MTKNKAYRHGEIVFLKIDKLPKDLKEEKTNIFSKGNTGNNHTFEGGRLYPKIEGLYTIGYFKAKDTKLFHIEHSPKGGMIEDGYYKILKQSEFINGELKQVID